jgi:hypothetical protein
MTTNLYNVNGIWYTESALIEAMESAAIRLQAINKHNPLAQAEYYAIKDQYNAMLRVATTVGLTVDSEFRTN